MFCSVCGAALPAEATACPQCGRTVDRPQGQNSDSPPPAAQPPAAQPPAAMPYQGGLGSFLNFDIMITPTIMKIIYIVGSVGIAISALAVMFTGGGMGFLIGLFGGAFGLVYFRVLCEILILFFKMHGDISQIKSNTEQK